MKNVRTWHELTKTKDKSVEALKKDCVKNKYAIRKVKARNGSNLYVFEVLCSNEEFQQLLK